MSGPLELTAWRGVDREVSDAGGGVIPAGIEFKVAGAGSVTGVCGIVCMLMFPIVFIGVAGVSMLGFCRGVVMDVIGFETGAAGAGG